MPGAIAAGDLENAPAVTLDLPGDTSVRVEIPVENMTAGTVAVLVTADGGSEIVQDIRCHGERGGSPPSLAGRQ